MICTYVSRHTRGGGRCGGRVAHDLPLEFRCQDIQVPTGSELDDESTTAQRVGFGPCSTSVWPTCTGYRLRSTGTERGAGQPTPASTRTTTSLPLQRPKSSCRQCCIPRARTDGSIFYNIICYGYTSVIDTMLLFLQSSPHVFRNQRALRDNTRPLALCYLTKVSKYLTPIKTVQVRVVGASTSVT